MARKRNDLLRNHLLSTLLRSVGCLTAAALLTARAGAATIVEYPLPSGAARPTAVTAGPDGAVWFTSAAGNSVNRIGAGGGILSYPLPTPNSMPTTLTRGPDGNIWVGLLGVSKIARVTTSGVITQFSLPPGSAAIAITGGPDGSVWFTQESGQGDAIGRLTLAGCTRRSPCRHPREASTPSRPAATGICGSRKRE